MKKSNKKLIKLSIVLAVYSETQSLIETVERLQANDDSNICEIILVVHPSSSIECFETCKSLTKKYDVVKVHIQNQYPGLGWAFREGMQIAEGSHVAIMSGDLETEPEAIARMIQKIEETDCDVVVGNRWMNGGGFANYDGIKLILNWSFQKIFRVLYKTRIGDLTYGFKILRKDVFTSLKWEGTQHEFCVETTVRPIKMGYHLEQVPTIWIGRKEGESKNTFAKNFRYVRLAFKILME